MSDFVSADPTPASNLFLRSIVVLTVLIGMPVLATPQFSVWFDAQRGSPKRPRSATPPPSDTPTWEPPPSEFPIAAEENQPGEIVISTTAFQHDSASSAAAPSPADLIAQLEHHGARRVQLLKQPTPEASFSASCEQPLVGSPIYTRRFEFSGPTAATALAGLLAVVSTSKDSSSTVVFRASK